VSLLGRGRLTQRLGERSEDPVCWFSAGDALHPFRHGRLVLGAVGLFIEGSVLGGALGYQPGLIDYAILAWIVSSLATLGGTLGSGLEAGDDVREAAYTYHRERRTEDEDGSG
jgi:hypothetical protein